MVASGLAGLTMPIIHSVRENNNSKSVQIKYTGAPDWFALVLLFRRVDWHFDFRLPQSQTGSKPVPESSCILILVCWVHQMWIGLQYITWMAYTAWHSFSSSQQTHCPPYNLLNAGVITEMKAKLIYQQQSCLDNSQRWTQWSLQRGQNDNHGKKAWANCRSPQRNLLLQQH